MARPSEEWLEWILARYGIIPVWSEDDVKGILTMAVEISTENAYAASLDANSRMLERIVDGCRRSSSAQILDTLKNIAIKLREDAERVRQELDSRLRKQKET